MSQPKQTSNILYTAQNNTQKAVGELWRNSKLLIMLGEAGTGKTACSVGLSMLDLSNKRIEKIYLCRPTVTIEEDLGHLPGDLKEKLEVWMMPFKHVLSDMTHTDLNLIPNVEYLSINHCRGITVKNSVLIVDEAQNLTYKQFRAIATRCGRNGKIVFCGDLQQSDIFAKPLPLELACQKLIGIDGVNIVTFNSSDQLRDSFVTKINKALD